ncbi:MAG: hypothetical protein R2876_05660 [Eubacteriales bacterium]
MKKLFSILIIIIILAFSFSSCTASSEGFESSAEPYSGGDSSISENVNVKSISITQEGSRTKVDLYFLLGSVLSGKEESKLGGLPAFDISFLSSPARMVVRIQNVDYYDYSYYGGTKIAGLVSGIFNVVPANDSYIDIYFDLSSDVTYKVSEENDHLIIYLQKDNELKTAYYTVTNLFSSYQEGTFPDSLAYTPILCSDQESIILISDPFDTEAEANSFKEVTEQSISSSFGAVVKVISLEGDKLPDVISFVDISEIIEAPSMQKGGEDISLEAILNNGRFLDNKSDGSILFSRSYIMDEATAEDLSKPVYERLWIKTASGDLEQQTLPDFSRITKAKFSPSGNYIVILDISDDNAILYAYDISENDLINLSEEGLGSVTDDFCFDKNNDIIYCISGSNTSKQIMKVELNNGNAISAVEESPTNASKIINKNGRLFVTDDDESGNTHIYEITSTGRTLIADGVDFNISNDGTYMSVITMDIQQDGGEIMGLVGYNLETGTETPIASNIQIQQMGFVGDTLYYITPPETANDGFNYQLNAYSFPNNKLSVDSLLITGDIYTDENNIYPVYYLSGPDNTSDYYITFVYPIN